MEDNNIIIRCAEKEQAKEIGEVLILSIKEIAASIHKFDSEIIDFWCQNKNVASIQAQLNDSNCMTVVMLRIDEVIGVGAIRSNGEITCCYLRPDAIGFGFGSQLLHHLMALGKEQGNTSITIESSLYACDFYLKHNFRITGNNKYWGPIEMTPMRYDF